MTIVYEKHKSPEAVIKNCLVQPCKMNTGMDTIASYKYREEQIPEKGNCCLGQRLILHAQTNNSSHEEIYYENKATSDVEWVSETAKEKADEVVLTCNLAFLLRP